MIRQQHQRKHNSILNHHHPCPMNTKNVTFAEILVHGYSDAPILEQDDWDNIHLSRWEKKRIRERADHRAMAISDESHLADAVSTGKNNRIVHNSSNNNNNFEYGLIINRAHQSCRSRRLGDELTDEEALQLTQWIIHCPARRGLERCSVPGLGQAARMERTNAVQAVLSCQRNDSPTLAKEAHRESRKDA